MNIIDAIKSGKRFKRPTPYGPWFIISGQSINDEYGNIGYLLTADDVLSDDWEVEEEKPIALTKSQARELFEAGYKLGKEPHLLFPPETECEHLLDILGFK